MKYTYDISPEEFEQIERFLNGEMNHDEAEAFREALKGDEVLQQKLEEVRLLSIGVSQALLRQSLDDFHKEIPGKTLTRKSGQLVSMRRVFLAAASVLVIGLVGWWLFFRGDKNERLYSDYYKPDPGLITAMGVSTDYIFDKAMVDYKNGDYAKAIDGWTSLLKAKPGSDTLNYFLGAAYQAQKDYDQAIAFLEKITNVPSHSFYQDACWYLGLIYLKKQDAEKARLFLERSGRPGSQKLLEALKSR